VLVTTSNHPPLKLREYSGFFEDKINRGELEEGWIRERAMPLRMR